MTNCFHVLSISCTHSIYPNHKVKLPVSATVFKKLVSYMQLTPSLNPLIGIVALQRDGVVGGPRGRSKSHRSSSSGSNLGPNQKRLQDIGTLCRVHAISYKENSIYVSGIMRFLVLNFHAPPSVSPTEDWLPISYNHETVVCYVDFRALPSLTEEIRDPVDKEKLDEFLQVQSVNSKECRKNALISRCSCLFRQKSDGNLPKHSSMQTNLKRELLKRDTEATSFLKNASILDTRDMSLGRYNELRRYSTLRTTMSFAPN
eukprot:Platyproteum_vivax@DN5770_c0_g1_i1.p1